MNNKIKIEKLYSELMDNPDKISIDKIIELDKLGLIDKHTLKTIEHNFNSDTANRILCFIPKLAEKYVKIDKDILEDELNTEEELEGFSEDKDDDITIKNLWILDSNAKKTILDIITYFPIEEIEKNKPLIAVLQHSDVDFEKLYRKTLQFSETKIEWLKNVNIFTTSVNDNVIARKIFNISRIDKDRVLVSNMDSDEKVISQKQHILDIKRLSNSYSQSAEKYNKQEEEESENILDNIQYSGQVYVQHEIDKGQQSTLQQNAIAPQQIKTLAKEDYSSPEVNLSFTDDVGLDVEQNLERINYDDIQQRIGSADTRFTESEIVSRDISENKIQSSDIAIASDSNNIQYNQKNSELKHEKQQAQNIAIQVGQ